MSNDTVGQVSWTVRSSDGRLAGAAMTSCAGPAVAVTADAHGSLIHQEQVMGTVVSFEVHAHPKETDRARRAIGEACQALHRADATFSTWLPDSPLSRLRRGEVTLSELDPAVGDVLELCREAKLISRGWFDPWAMPGGVDPTGLVKGWALDVALEKLRNAEVEAALLNAGGDLVAFGSPGDGEGWRIGIRHPWASTALACIVELRAAVATSGPYERGAHLIDPRSGEPAQAMASATVTGPNLAMCDALATALAVGGDDVLGALAALDGYEGYMIGADGSEVATDGMVFLD